MARVLLNTFGSFGDLHPYLAIAIGLRNRGHNAVVATSEVYRAKVEAEGIEFAPVRPDVGELLDKPNVLEKVWHPRNGTESLIRDYILPHLEHSYEDLVVACRGADLLLTHVVAFAGPIIAEKTNLPWLSVALQPSLFLSAYDPPVLAPAPWLKYVYKLGRAPSAWLLSLGKHQLRNWFEPVLHMRRRHALREMKDPFFAGQFSPFGTLALFSKHFARPQPDWPANVTQTGFVFYDRRGPGFGEEEVSAARGLAPELDAFLKAGSPPVVFTLGSSAVMHPGEFYRESLAAAERLGSRAVLLVGPAEREALGRTNSDLVHIAEYAPYSELMPRAAATVHQGGIGTTAQALRSGRPMLVVPWSHDQPDNAERIRKLGVGRVLARKRYTAKAAAAELSHLLQERTYRERAAQMGAAVSGEDGLSAACDEIEAVLERISAPHANTRLDS